MGKTTVRGISRRGARSTLPRTVWSEMRERLPFSPNERAARLCAESISDQVALNPHSRFEFDKGTICSLPSSVWIALLRRVALRGGCSGLWCE